MCIYICVCMCTKVIRIQTTTKRSNNFNNIKHDKFKLYTRKHESKHNCKKKKEENWDVN